MSRYKELAEVLAGVTEAHDMQRLMQELLTPKELEDIGRRWQILKDLYAGMPQREIAERHKMSLCKVTRGSKVLQSSGSVCKAMIEKRIKK
jgi:TrpR family trp operon transcriptional repressor